MVMLVNPMFSGGASDAIGFVAGTGFERTTASDFNLPSGAEVDDIAIAYEMSSIVPDDVDEQTISWTTAVSGNERTRFVRVFYKKLVTADLSAVIPRKILELSGTAPTAYRGCVLIRAPSYAPAHFDAAFDAAASVNLSVTVAARAVTGWRIGCGVTISEPDTVNTFANADARSFNGGNTSNLITIAPILESEAGTFGFERASSTAMWLGGFNLELTL